MMAIEQVTGLILAGGAGSRVGGLDKGLIQWSGSPLITQVANRLKKQTQTLIVSCNRNIGEYRSLGFHTVEDQRKGFAGPLAGIEAAHTIITTPYLAVVACDLPMVPLDLVERLISPLLHSNASGPIISIAHDGQREQYLCAVMKVSCLATLSDFLQQGHRAVKHWYKQNPHVLVDFSDQPLAFRNHNYPGDYSGQ